MNPEFNVLYGRRWRNRRKAYLQENPLCVECLDRGITTAASIVDHVVPHEGDPELFWNGELQAMCKHCHDKFKQEIERHGFSTRVDIDGKPVDPKHPSLTGRKPNVGLSGKMSRPAWMRKACIPTTIVCGAPGSGKSSYVRLHAHPSDRIICFDEIATRLFGRLTIERTAARLTVSQIADVLRVRNEAIADLMWAKAKARWNRAWIILTEPTGNNRQWWAKTLGATVLLMPTAKHECLSRIESDAANGDDRGRKAVAYLNEWFAKFTPAPCDRDPDPLVALQPTAQNQWFL